jgi:uncharacterized protein YjbI with pentapeptide repeats
MKKIRKQLLYDTYLDDISKYLLISLNDSAEKTKLHVRAITLNVLLNLGSSQKREIILFLDDSYLVRSDYLQVAIHLSTADLTSCHFKHLCNLNNLYLPGVLADNIVFDGCKLRRVLFNGFLMVGAKFIRSHASGSHFDAIILTHTIFIQTNSLKINFVNTILVHSSFADGSNLQKVNLMNVDRFESDLIGKQLTFRHFFDFNTPQHSIS